MFTMCHIYWMLAIIEINSVTSTPCCKLASTKACFNAVDRELSTIFNAPVSGTIIGVNLVHESGSVYCNGKGYTNWGCEYFGEGMLTYFEKVVEIGSGLGYPTGEKYYPTSETNDITSEYDYGWSQVYKMSTFDIHSEQVLFINPKYNVAQSDQFMLQYSEADGESRGDNAGTACASVYFVYDSESVGQCDFDCATTLPPAPKNDEKPFDIFLLLSIIIVVLILLVLCWILKKNLHTNNNNVSGTKYKYKVVYANGARCRQAKDLKSRDLGIIPFDSIVIVEQIIGNRCRISSPKIGWLSLCTSAGDQVLEKEAERIETTTEGVANYYTVFNEVL